MQVKKINSTQISLVEFDWIPFSRLLHESAISGLQARLGFSSVEVRSNPQSQPSIVFAIGKFIDGSNDYTIKRLEIEERKITIEVEEHSKIADRVFLEVTKFMEEISGQTNEVSIFVRAKESVIIAKMDFPATSLVDSKLLEYVNSKVTNVSQLQQGTATASFHTVAFRLDYEPTDDKLKDYRIGLSRKEFSLGPRDGTTLSEQIFISKAPVDTDTHLELLNDIEKTYARKDK